MEEQIEGKQNNLKKEFKRTIIAALIIIIILIILYLINYKTGWLLNLSNLIIKG